MALARPAHRLLTTLTAWAVAAQFFLAGSGAFGATSFDPHRVLGFVVVVMSIVVLGAAAAARRYVRQSALVVLLVLVQVGLAEGADHSSKWFGAFHGLNALAVMIAVGLLARRAWQER